MAKDLYRLVDGVKYARYPIKTHVISNKDDIVDVVQKYAGQKLKKGDIVVISERVVAITQGRMILISDIKPSSWAKLLVKFVYKPSWGIGIGSPYTMQVAIDEAGLWRILLAGAVSALTKPFGIRGLFYKIVGHGINAIDGPTSYTLPPGNKAATLGPKDPDHVSQQIKDVISHEVAIIDANDIGQRIEGATKNINHDLICKIFQDNPLGQSREQTPIAIVRKL
ncbi:MAG: coenzyme F420-0:L-glutamate ligase [Patescibacteria group bacterium]|mgnify:CR=1 FL=1